MKLYKISQSINNDYDTYDSAVVVASSPQQAKRIHPSDLYGTPAIYEENDPHYVWKEHDTWAHRPGQVTVEYLGTAAPTYKKPTIICASFNAG